MTKIVAEKDALLEALRGIEPTDFSGVIHAENGRIRYKAKDETGVASIMLEVEDDRIDIEDEGILPIDQEGIDMIFSSKLKRLFSSSEKLEIEWKGEGEYINITGENGEGYGILPSSPKVVGLHDVEKGSTIDDDGTWCLTDKLKATIKIVADKSEIEKAKTLLKATKTDYVDLEFGDENIMRSGHHGSKSNRGHDKFSATIQEGEGISVSLPEQFVDVLNVLKSGNISMQTLPQDDPDSMPYPFVMIQENEIEEHGEELLIIGIGPKKRE